MTDAKLRHESQQQLLQKQDQHPRKNLLAPQEMICSTCSRTSIPMTVTSSAVWNVKNNKKRQLHQKRQQLHQSEKRQLHQKRQQPGPKKSSSSSWKSHGTVVLQPPKAFPSSGQISPALHLLLVTALSL
jgi:hypothetical protein